MSQLLLTDIDNTLYDWPAFFAPSFRAMVHALARELAIPESDLELEFKAVFSAHQSLEYAFVVQELPSVQWREPDEIRRLVKVGRGAFRSVQRRRLRPYPGVVDTLRWLRLQGHAVVGVTNSPAHRAQQRLYNLNLDSLLTGLVAWKGTDTSRIDPSTAGFKVEGATRDRTRLKEVRTVAEGECKPDPRQYAIALEQFGSDPANCWAVGDSLRKDLEPAAALGIRTVWARYGSAFDPDEANARTLLNITHWTETRISHTYADDGFSPDFTIDGFDELQKLLPQTVLTLF